MKRQLAFLTLATMLLVSMPLTVGTIESSENPQIFHMDEIRQGESKPTGGQLRIGMHDFYLIEVVAADLVFSTMLRVNETLQFIPNVATDWSISDDGLTCNFTISDQFRWHDDTPLTPEDVAFTIDAFWGAPIESITVIGNIVQIQLTKPYSPFLFQIGDQCLIPKHIYENKSVAYAFDFENNPDIIGSGPFKFKSIHVGHSLTLEFSKYYPQRAYLNEIVFKLYPDTELPKALENNEIDLIPKWVLPEKMADLEAKEGVTPEASPEIGYYSLDYNLREPITNETLVRQGISCLIDRMRIVNEVFYGYAEEADSPVPRALAYWYNENVPKFDNFTEGLELLELAGYPVNKMTGWRFDLSIKVGDWDSVRISIANIIAECLIDASINATVELRTMDQYYEEGLGWNMTHWYLYGEYRYDEELIDFQTWVCCYEPGHTSIDSLAGQYELWHSAGYFGRNVYGYNNSQIDDLLEIALKTMDDATRRGYLYKIQEIIATDVPVAFVIIRTHLTAYHNDFHGFLDMAGALHVVKSYCLEQVFYDPTLSAEVNCPVYYAIIKDGNRTGYDPSTGTFVAEIPDSYIENNITKIRHPKCGDYLLEIYGLEDGTYDLEVVNIALHYKNMYLPTGTIRQNQTRTYKIRLFEDGSIDSFNCAADFTGEEGVPNNKIDLYDAVTLLKAYGSEPGDPGWNMTIDIAPPLNKIDLYDAVQLLVDYGKKWSE